MPSCEDKLTGVLQQHMEFRKLNNAIEGAEGAAKFGMGHL
jgi:hypothetical protein